MGTLRVADPTFSLHRNHLDVAQSRDRKHRVLAGLDRHRRNDAAGDHHHAGFETAAAFGEVIGEPGQRRARVFGKASAGRFAVDLEPAGDAVEQRGRDGFGRADDDAAVPAIFHDQRSGVGRGVIGIAVFDQLEGGHRGRDRRRHHVAPPRRAGGRQIGAEHQRNLAFDADVDEIRGVQVRRRVVDGVRKDRAAAGMVDAHQLLHHLGGGGDLGAAHRAIDRLRQPVIGLLRRIGLGAATRVSAQPAGCDRAGGGRGRPTSIGPWRLCGRWRPWRKL